MLDTTILDVISLDLERQFELDPDATAVVRARGGTVLATLTQATSGWHLYDPGDDTLTLKVSSTLLSRTQLGTVVDVVVTKSATEVPFVWVNPTRVEWKQGSSRIATLKGFRPGYPLPSTMPSNALLTLAGEMFATQAGEEMVWQ